MDYLDAYKPGDATMDVLVEYLKHDPSVGEKKAATLAR